jgi:hypothetical protein
VQAESQTIQIINICIGAITAAFTTVIQFWLGSSLGSKTKDNALAQSLTVSNLPNVMTATQQSGSPPPADDSGSNVKPAPSSGTVDKPASNGTSPTPKPSTPPPQTKPQPVPPGLGAPLASGKGSWYSQYQGKYTWVDNGDAPNSNALGVPDADQGVSFLNPSTLGKWFEVHDPNGDVSIEQQTDIGPAASTGRSIDISAAAAERFGYSPQNFPTNATFQWRPISAPQEVINLSPKQQAIAYQKLRGTATVPPTPGPTTATTPAWITLGRSFDDLVWTKSSGPMPAKIVTWMDDIAKQFPEMAPYVKTCKNDGTAGWWAWCGAFVQSMLAYSNIRGPISAAGLKGEMTTADWAYNTAWENWGTKVWMPSDGSINDAQPQSGDVLVWSFGHVSFYDHHDDTTNTFFSLGGDQGTPLRVCVEPIAMSSCIAIRRPPVPTPT